MQTVPRSLTDLAPLLTMPSDAIVPPKEPTFSASDIAALRTECTQLKQQLSHLTALLSESEESCARLTDQTKVRPRYSHKILFS